MLWEYLQANPGALAIGQSSWDSINGTSTFNNPGSIVKTVSPLPLSTTQSSPTGDIFSGIQDFISGLVKSIFGIDLPAISQQVYLLLGAYGLYRYMKGKRNWITWTCLGIGAYGSGILDTLFPGGAKSGATGVALSAISPTLALGSVFGIGVPLIAGMFKKKKRTYYRRRSYRRTNVYYLPRRSYRRS